MFSAKNAALVQVPAPENGERISSLLTRKDQQTLKKLGFLVDDPETEKKEMLGFITGLNNLNRTLNLKVVMNLDCNLGCIYCFEGTRKGRFYMSEETAAALLQFVKRRCSEETFEEIHLVFYGGEPLLSRKLISHIAEEIQSFAREKRIEFGFSLQTNGTLLTEETVRKLKPLGLSTAYVTIDGPQENHNRFRPYKSGRASFGRIVRNVLDVCRHTEIRVNGNFTKDNYQAFPQLLDSFSDIGFTPAEVPFVQFFPVLSEQADTVPDFHGGCSCINESWLVGASLFLREEVLKRGYKNERIMPGFCMMEYQNNMLVNYNGDIYKCPSLISRKEFCVGNIKTGMSEYQSSHHLDNWKNEECLSCSYLPLCFGGCRAMKYVRDGNMDGVDCKKPYLDACLETLVKQDIKYGLTG